MTGEPQLPDEAVARARAALETVLDPEVPVLSVVELGIVRDVQVEDGGTKAVVTVTPTYSGCPALSMIEDEMTAVLQRAGFAEVKIEKVYAPAWTTDWISEPARDKLRAYGIAPPGALVSAPLIPLGATVRKEACPYCGSGDTTLVSEFGATACKSLHFCRGCRQPFEHFKPF